MSDASASASVEPSEKDLGSIIVTLLKGVLYKDPDSKLWSQLLWSRSHVGHFVSILGLTLQIDEAEGYAFLRSASTATDEQDATPRIIARRALTFYDSVLLALLRKKLLEFDASAAESRLMLKRDEIQEMFVLFLPEHTDDLKLRARLDPSVQRLQEMGFLRRLKSSPDAETYEVLRVIKAFVDAQWLNGLENGLAAYRTHSSENQLQ